MIWWSGAAILCRAVPSVDAGFPKFFQQRCLKVQRLKLWCLGKLHVLIATLDI